MLIYVATTVQFDWPRGRVPIRCAQFSAYASPWRHPPRIRVGQATGCDCVAPLGDRHGVCVSVWACLRWGPANGGKLRKFKCQAQLQLGDVLYMGLVAGLRHGGPGGLGLFDVWASSM